MMLPLFCLAHLPKGGTSRQEGPIQMDGEQLFPF